MIAQAASLPAPVGFGRGRRTNRIAVLQCPTSLFKMKPAGVQQWDLTEELDPWTRVAVSGYLIGAEATGFDLMWHQWLKSESPRDIAESLREEVDGAILLAPRREHFLVLPLLAAQGLPCVVAYARRPELDSPFVVCDNAGGMAQIVHHLARLGHRRIALFGGPEAIIDMRERKEGFLAGLAVEGLIVDPSLLVGDTLPRLDEASKPIALSLLRQPQRPTAIVCATDVVAQMVVEAAWEIGLNVPQDIAVTGFDDSDEATLIIPQLTTVRQPVLEIANRSWYLIACAVEGQTPETVGWQLQLPTTLVVRESCGAMLAASGEVPGSKDGRPKAMRRELELRMRQLAAVNDEMQELLYVASHDLRAPLVTIQGFASSLDRKYGGLLDARGRSYLHRIMNSVDTLRELIDALLTLSRTSTSPLRFGPVRVGDVVTRVLHDLEGMIAETRARVRVQRRLPTVLADELALYQVFANLVSNAVKFSGDGSEPEVTIGHSQTDDEHEFFVRDNGVGLPPEHHEEVFQVFRRLGESRTQGSGVGLAIVKRMVLRHGGRVWVESQSGQGATFRFTLPRRELDHVSVGSEDTDALAAHSDH